MNKTILNKLLNWVITMWYPNMTNSDEAQALIKIYLEQSSKWVKLNGPKWTIKRLKSTRLLVTRYLSGYPLKTNEFGISTDKSGFPKWIRGLKPFIQSGENDDLRFVLTLLAVSRTYKYQSSPDYSSVTDPFKGTNQSLNKELLQKIVEDFNLSFTLETQSTGKGENFNIKDFSRLTGKAGPSGHALSTAMWQMDKLPDAFKASIGCLIGDDLILWLTKASSFLPKKLREEFGKVKRISLRRLALVQDPEMKCRVIAMGDYWSQGSLRPLHKQLFRILRTKFPSDRTFDQNPYITKVCGHKFHSLDLTAATDRIPAVLQRDILELMTGSKNQAYSWWILMTQCEFETPDPNINVRYSVGQPMGLLSSWAMMATTHHIIVQYAALSAGVYPFKDYILLGDDIVIANDDVANEYKKVMSYLGVDISEAKSHVSEDLYEFAKRWFFKGTEVTGLPLTGFVDNFHNPILMVSQIYDQVRKGNGYGRIGLPIHEVLADLYWKSAGVELKPKWVRSALNKAENFITLQRLCHNFNYDLARAWIIKWLPDEAALPMSEEKMQKIIADSALASVSVLSEQVMSDLMSVDYKFKMKIKELWPEIEQIDKDLHYHYYRLMVPFWAVFKALEDQNQDDILLNDLYDIEKAVESVVVPNMETAFTARRSVELAFGFNRMTKATIEFIQKFTGDVQMFTRNRARTIAAGWVGGIEDISKLQMSPDQARMASMNSMLFI